MLIGLDIGSSSVKAVALGEAASRRAGSRVVREARRRIATRRGPGGRVTHDAGEILCASVEVLRAVARPGGAERLGLATQRSTVLFWDRDNGRPLTPAFSWQDLGGAAICARLRRGGRRAAGGGADAGRLVGERTGLRLTPYYSAPKIARALADHPALRRRLSAGRALWGTLGTFIAWRLSDGAVYAIDHASAQRTLLFNPFTLSWDHDLFRLFGLETLLDAPVLPALVPTILSAPAILRTKDVDLRLAAVTGDQQAALLGSGCHSAGDVAINYGSGAFVLVHLGASPRRFPGLLTTLLMSRARSDGSIEAHYAVEGTVNAAATAIDWAVRRLGIRVHTSGLDRFLGPDEGGPRRVHFLPAVAGVGAPRWDAAARPRFFGDAAHADPRDRLRAVVESIACRCAEIAGAAGLGAARGTGRWSRPILVAGGLTRCRTLLQAQADLLGRTLRVSPSPDATAIGAASMARAGWRDAAATVPPLRKGLLVRPRLSRAAAGQRFRAWVRAVYGAR